MKEAAITKRYEAATTRSCEAAITRSCEAVTTKSCEAAITRSYDVVVIGGGLSGLCAALASARHGAKTALVQNRPVLGGNASSEIRMHVGGADCHGKRPNARETGIIEELMLENQKRNPQHSFSIFDTILWEKAAFQENLDLYLNTHMESVNRGEGRILSVTCFQMTTEKTFLLKGGSYIDATGDGYLAALAGAEFMTGREGMDAFGEQVAPKKGDSCTMGNTLMFTARDMGRPMPFEKPSWAWTFTDEDIPGHQAEITSGYWWIELGGDTTDIIQDGEILRDNLLKALYGIWDHIKNGGDHGAENYALDWVGFLPGKRESRRVVGPYILREQDLVEGRRFPDAVAYGGWHLDLHPVGGLLAEESEIDPAIAERSRLREVYTIPYSSLYARDVDNLFLGGRAISVSHVAFGSTRVMATCSVAGQAVGTAAALCAAKGFGPAGLVPCMDELQQALLKDDCHIPGLKNEDIKDLARTAEVVCSSETEQGKGANLIDGWGRGEAEKTHCWISAPFTEDPEPWVELRFKTPVNPSEIRLKFDSNLSREYLLSISQWQQVRHITGAPPELARDYTLTFYCEGVPVFSSEYKDNYLRFRVHKIEDTGLCDRVRLTVKKTHGALEARIFEMRVY